MPDYKDVLKNGWNPTWDKTKIDRTNYKDPRKWIQKDDSSERAQSHQAAPLSALKDPASFAPPPKHTKYYSEDGSPLSPVTPVSSLSAAPSASSVVVRDSRNYDTSRGGLGGALSGRPLSEQKQLEAQAEADKPKPPPAPYRVNTTSLRTDHLPPPPVRRDAGGVASPNSPSVPARTPISASAALPSAAAPTAPKPSLPPRLPQRQNSNPGEFTPAPPPAYSAATASPLPAPRSSIAPNTAALTNLAQASISVQGLGITPPTPAAPLRPRPSASSSPSPLSPATPAAAAGVGASTLSELQSRFSTMSTSRPPAPAPKPKPATIAAPGPSGSGAAPGLVNAAGALAAAAARKAPAPPVPPPVPRGSKPGKSSNGSRMHPGVGLAGTDSGFDGGGGGG